MATRKPLVRVSGKIQQLPDADVVDVPGSRFTESETEPTVKDYGDRWLDETSGIEYTWISPGVWVDLATAGIDFDDLVQTTGDQTVAGVKTFSSTIVGSVSGNAGTVTNGVYTTGAQPISGVKTFTDSPVVPGLNGGQLAGFRNKIINGNPLINQRGYVSGSATTAGQYTLDRWKVTGTGGITFSTTDNKTTVTIPSGQTWQQVVEGLNLESGDYVLSWDGTAQGRIAGGSYGASGAVTASITGGTDTTIEFNTGTVALVMLEKGTVATPFEHRNYGMELSMCQRYYCRIFPGVANRVFGNAFASSVGSGVPTIYFPVPMRVPPTALEQSGTANHFMIAYKNSSSTLTSVPTFSAATIYSAVVGLSVSGNPFTAGEAIQLRTDSTNGASAYLGWSAEL